MNILRMFVCILMSGWLGNALAEDEVLYLYNWSEYMPESVLQQFQKETGIKVVYTTYESNESMYAKLRLVDEKNSYDLVVPSTYYVNKMRREGLLAKIDKKKLPNFNNLEPNLLNKAYDENNEYSVPYLWGSTGISINSKKVKPGSVTKWRDLWDPKFKDRLLLTNDMREVFYMGLRVLGYSGNDTNPEHIKAAYEELRKLIPNVRAYNSEAPRMPYLEGETDAGMIWNGEAYTAKQANPDIEYIYPQEGVILWMDSLVIPKKARHIESAHKFINFILRPEIGKTISEEVGYASPNKASVALLDEEVRSNRTVYPTQEDLKNSEFQTDVGNAITVYEKYWERLKTGSK